MQCKRISQQTTTYKILNTIYQIWLILLCISISVELVLVLVVSLICISLLNINIIQTTVRSTKKAISHFVVFAHCNSYCSILKYNLNRNKIYVRRTWCKRVEPIWAFWRTGLWRHVPTSNLVGVSRVSNYWNCTYVLRNILTACK